MKDKHVLIIDDDTAISGVLQELFTAKGAVVTVANSYATGIEAIKTPPDAAIVDMILDGHSGLDLVREAQKTNSSTFFVILTNSVNVQDIADAMEAHVTTFIQKADHDPAEIVEIVAKHFEK